MVFPWCYDVEKSRTYTNDESLFDQTRELPLARAPLPEPARLLVGRHVDRLERDAVGFENCLHARGRGDDVRGSRGQGGVEEESGIVLEIDEARGAGCHGR